MKFNNKTYDILKDIALYVLPALATFILALGNIWGIPYAEAIVATITAIDTFLGAVLKISTNKYNAMQEMHEADAALANSPLYPEDEKEGE